MNRLIKTGGLLEERAAYDVLLNDKLPKMLLVFSIKRAGIIKPMLSRRLAEVVHEAAALLERDGAMIIYKPGGGRIFSHAYVVSKRTGLITGKPSANPIAPHGCTCLHMRRGCNRPTSRFLTLPTPTIATPACSHRRPDKEGADQNLRGGAGRQH